MEVIYHDFNGQEKTALTEMQVRTEQQIELPAGAKKVVAVTGQIYLQGVQLENSEVTMTGNLVTRLLYLDEFDQYDSQETTAPWEQKITEHNFDGVTQVSGTVCIVETEWSVAENNVAVQLTLAVRLDGVRVQSTRLVADLTGEVEVKKSAHKIMCLQKTLQEKLALEETIVLEDACEGVLGVDSNAFVKDVSCGDGKVVVKGVVAVNVLGVKKADDGKIPYNQTTEIDFVKSILAAGTTPEDLAGGQVQISAQTMHIDNTKGLNLVLNYELLFTGCVGAAQTFDTVTDAISFQNELSFESTALNCREMQPQMNTTIDLENNLNLPSSQPYVARVLAVDGVKINHLQVTPGDGKLALEGVLTANVLVENEEHLTSNYLAEAPFQSNLRLENLAADDDLCVAVTPLLLNVKARRGVELLLDAKLGVSVQTVRPTAVPVVTAVVPGKTKTEDDSALRIYIIGEKETLWDLAKRTNLSSEELIKQNPNLANTCTPGERIVVYRHEEIKL